MRVIELSEYFDFPLYFLEYTLLLDFLLVENFDSDFVSSDLIKCNYNEQLITSAFSLNNPSYAFLAHILQSESHMNMNRILTFDFSEGAGAEVL